MDYFSFELDLDKSLCHILGDLAHVTRRLATLGEEVKCHWDQLDRTGPDDLQGAPPLHWASTFSLL